MILYFNSLYNINLNYFFMFDAIIPMRSGSKGINNKNLVNFHGEKLANYTIKKLLKIKEIKRIFILTDSLDYKKKFIKDKRINFEYIRQKKLSRDNSNINHVVYDFLIWSKKKFKLEKILFFHVTTPLISVQEIKKSISFIKKNKLQSLIHVSEMLEPPYECINKTGKNWKFLVGNYVTNRQNFKNFYFITGSMYYFTLKFFLKYKKAFNEKSYAYKVDKINFVDINTSFDLEIAKRLKNLKQRN